MKSAQSAYGEINVMSSAGANGFNINNVNNLCNNGINNQ
jgi:hypothetical protein